MYGLLLEINNEFVTLYIRTGRPSIPRLVQGYWPITQEQVAQSGQDWRPVSDDLCGVKLLNNARDSYSQLFVNFGIN
jgi:hypothetical protein